MMKKVYYGFYFTEILLSQKELKWQKEDYCRLLS